MFILSFFFFFICCVQQYSSFFSFFFLFFSPLHCPVAFFSFCFFCFHFLFLFFFFYNKLLIQCLFLLHKISRVFFFCFFFSKQHKLLSISVNNISLFKIFPNPNLRVFATPGSVKILRIS